MRRISGLPSWLPTLLVALGIFALVLFAYATGMITAYWYGIIQLAALTAISALGLNLIYGFNGQFSLGHIGFYAIGAYGSALITKDYLSSWSGSKSGALSWMLAAQVGLLVTVFVVQKMRLGELAERLKKSLGKHIKAHEAGTLIGLVLLVLGAIGVAVGAGVTIMVRFAFFTVLEALFSVMPAAVGEYVVLVIALITGGTLASFVAYLVGRPLLRLGSDYFGIATLGFAIMVYTALQNSDMVIPTMKGARGMVGIPTWTTWPWAFGCLVLVLVVLRNLIHSSYGRSIIAVREDEIAAKTMGIDVVKAKTLAFAIGGFLAGVAGGLYAHLYGFLHPSTFNVVKGFDPLIIIVFGGLGSMTGTVVASALFALVIEGLRVVLPQGFEDWRFVIYPIILLLVMLLRQQGLLGNVEWGWLRAPLPPKRQAVASEEGPPATEVSEEVDA
jgi:branched-chain amino acid transport system permease protein